ncbi:MAG TPA: dickkopf-related protein [Polyangiaceae bacterium]|jgi:hypothetical protein
MLVKRGISALGVAATFGLGVWLAACGSGDDSSVFDGGPDVVVADSGVADTTIFDVVNPFGDTGTTPITSLTIQPQDPVVTATITDGVLSTTPITFTALGNGNVPVAASFTLDRGELGTLSASTGVFTASGNVSGTGNVTATYNGASGPDGGPLVATTTVTVQVSMSQNGKPPLLDGGADASTLGGNNGVGGNDYGGTVSTATKTVLDGNATAPANAQELGFLYPYDKTVWPQGILAPLLQWQSTHASATTAVKIHLAEKGFSFDGYYAAPGWVNEPIDQTAWSKALYGNQGDPLEVDVYVTDGTTSWGPITEHWTVAHGVLKGTVYYNSYNSELTATSNGAVLAIQPGAMAPTVAVPGTQTACHVCHEVSANGSTMFITDGDYKTTKSYDLTNGGAVLSSYAINTTAPDGTKNDAKFVWSAIYPDGTFAMTEGNNSREGPWYQGNDLNSELYRRSDGSRVTYQSGITETGWSSAVTDALEPMFSPDGKHITFNFWGGPGANGVTAGSGHSLAAMDFDCGQGQVDGGAPSACSGSTYAFSNLRQLYKDTTRYVGWPQFTPDSNGIIFHDTITVAPTCNDCWTTTWAPNGGVSTAELWYTDLGTTPQPLRMNWLNGLDQTGTSYLPTNANHGNDAIMNYEPTVNPIPSGGYFWVVFTSRRMYGNVAAGAPYDNGNGTYPIPKKLWVAAIDINPAPGTDPSHPAFYLPGQELNAGNLRGFWVVDPCKANGNACITGDECCNGFCRQDSEAGGLVCSDNTGGCSQEFEACTSNADCCGTTLSCINGHCAQNVPN